MNDPGVTSVSPIRPLDGIRVIEVATGIRGPVAARMLAEVGADVVKVETAAGDPWRTRLPAGFATWNRSKRSTVLDLGSASDVETLHDLLERADVLIHDLPAAAARELGLDADSMHARHPAVVVGSVPSYPAGHPRADEDVADTLVQAAEGLMDEQQGHRPGPIFVRVPYSSWSAAYLLATGVVARLVQRERTGVVLPIQTSLFQGALTTAALYWQRWERLPETLTKHTLPKIDPDAALSIFQCADGRWVQLAGAVGGWIESPPVLEALALADRVELSEVGVTRANLDQWNAIFNQHDSEWWRKNLSDVDVPCMIVRELGDCFTSEQAAVNGYVVEIDDPVVGRRLQAGPPVSFSAACGPRGAAPMLGGSPAAEILASWSVRQQRPLSEPSGDARPLAGLRGLDFGSAIAGPYGAQCLADLGVEVVKVEPLGGDRGRWLTQFAGSHRGKGSLALDLKSEASRRPLERLLRRADVVLHNMRPGPAARLGIDGPGLRAVNPRIAFSHVSAYGPVGEMASFPGYDPTAQAFTGWESAAAGEGMPPMWLRSSVFDVQAGIAAAFGAVVALLQREVSGVPGEASTSLLALAISASSELVVDPDTGEKSSVDVLSADQTGVSAYHRIYQTRDGWVAVAALDVAERAAFDAAVGDVEEVRGWFGGHTVASAVSALRAAGVPCERVALDQLDAFHDSEIHRRIGVSRTLETVGFGRIDVVGGWWDFGPAAPDESIPALGQHSIEVLRDAGESDDEVASLIAQRVVYPGGDLAVATK